MSIDGLPNELLLKIIEKPQLPELFNLSLSCQRNYHACKDRLRRLRSLRSFCAAFAKDSHRQLSFCDLHVQSSSEAAILGEEVEWEDLVKFQARVMNNGAEEAVKELPLVAVEDIDLFHKDLMFTDDTSASQLLQSAWRTGHPTECNNLEQMTSVLIARYPDGAAHLAEMLDFATRGSRFCVSLLMLLYCVNIQEICIRPAKAHTEPKAAIAFDDEIKTHCESLGLYRPNPWALSPLTTVNYHQFHYSRLEIIIPIISLPSVRHVRIEGCFNGRWEDYYGALGQFPRSQLARIDLVQSYVAPGAIERFAQCISTAFTVRIDYGEKSDCVEGVQEYNERIDQGCTWDTCVVGAMEVDNDPQSPNYGMSVGSRQLAFSVEDEETCRWADERRGRKFPAWRYQSVR